MKLKLKKEVELFNLNFSANKAVSVDGTPIILAPQGESVAMITTSAKDLTTALMAEVYPNPSTGEVSVEVSVSGKVKIVVTNMLGETAWTGSSDSGSMQLELSDLPKGTYFVKLESESGSMVKKLVLQ